MTRLDLNWNGLRGTLPPELTSLASLSDLAFSSTLLSGTLPPELGRSLFYPLLTGLSLLFGDIIIGFFFSFC